MKWMLMQVRQSLPFFSPIEQVLTVQDLGYVSTEQHGDHVSKMNMGIKQNYTPSVSLKPH
jgi:hypothetical protein